MSAPVQPYVRSQLLQSAAAKQQQGLLQAGDELDDSFTGLDVSRFFQQRPPHQLQQAQQQRHSSVRSEQQRCAS